MNIYKARIIMLLLLTAASWQTLAGAWIFVKAIVAQQLLEYAWQNTKVNQQPYRPWPWADTWPVARLTVAELNIDRIVLSGNSARTLAFGPAAAIDWAGPHTDKVMLISGHRDTHFRFLKDLRVGQVIEIETAENSITYHVSKTNIIDIEQTIGIDDIIGNTLILVTCYPFDAIIPGGPFRYVVIARAQPATALEI